VRILIVDDHLLVREGVRALFAADPNTQVFAALSSDEALSSYRENAPDVLLLDINLPQSSGFEILTRLLIEDPHAKIIVFSMYTEPIYVAHALNAGACGYVSKHANPSELIEAVHAVAAGGRYVEQEMATRLVLTQYSSSNPLVKLSTREIDVVRLLGQGLNHAAIAQKLGISPKTVANACSNIRKKTGIESTSELVQFIYSMTKQWQTAQTRI
jgi:two-component system, NarL family, invasion response regulator UvrY